VSGIVGTEFFIAKRNGRRADPRSSKRRAVLATYNDDYANKLSVPDRVRAPRQTEPASRSDSRSVSLPRCGPDC